MVLKTNRLKSDDFAKPAAICSTLNIARIFLIAVAFGILLLFPTSSSVKDDSTMWTEKKAKQYAGYVLFRRPADGGPREYLLIQQKKPPGWIFPKGAMGKTERRRPITAVRELNATTGLTLDNITQTDYKKIFMHGRPKRVKESAYYTGKVEDLNISITLNYKFSAYKWANFSQACQDLDIASQHALRECDNYFETNNY